jgi:hypothetical protein
MRATEEIRLEGHVIDSLTLPRVLDTVMDLGGDYAIVEFEIGKNKEDHSRARIRISAESEDRLREILRQVTAQGAELVTGADVRTEAAPRDGVLPDDFYSTTNSPTEVRLAGEWTPVEDIEMDVAVVLGSGRAPRGCPMASVREGDAVVVGHEGIRVRPREGPPSRSRS